MSYKQVMNNQLDSEYPMKSSIFHVFQKFFQDYLLFKIYRFETFEKCPILPAPYYGKNSINPVYLVKKSSAAGG
jgi:hypothetical protein